MRTRNQHRTQLKLVSFEAREVPAVINWIGSADTDWSNAANWDGATLPGAGDTVVLHGNPRNAPTIGDGQTADIAYIQLQDSATFDLTINGKLTTKGCLIQPTVAHGFVGYGSLYLGDTAGAAIDHEWVSGYVKVAKVTVDGGGVLNVRTTFGQLGPDEGTAGFWDVGPGLSAGTMQLNGDHFVGFDGLTVGASGVLKYLVGGTLTDRPPTQGAWDPFYIENVNQVEIAEGQAVGLTGGYYRQPLAPDAVTTFQPGSSLSIGRFDGAISAPDYAFDVTGGTVRAFEAASISSNQKDIRFQTATIDFQNPGIFTRGGVAGQVSTLGMTARDGMLMKGILIKDTPVKFTDWNPAGRYTATTQMDAKLSVIGNLTLDGTTELFLRMNVGGLSADSIVETDPAGQVTLNGNGLKLTANLKNVPAQPGMFTMRFISAPRVTAPAVPFGGGVTLTGATTGISNPTITKSDTGIALTVMKGM